jgi:hypothetical protein
MKKKISFPDWTSPAAVTITSGGTKDKPRAAWGEHTQDPAEWLSLRVTLEIAGGSVLFERFDSKEEEEAARLEANRRAARPEEESPELPVAFVPHWKTCGRG